MASHPLATASAIAVALLTLLSLPCAASEPTATEPPPIVGGHTAHVADPSGDTYEDTGPDIVSLAVTQGSDPLVFITVEFAAEPPLGYDMEARTTDMLMVDLTGSRAGGPDPGTSVTGAHGATLASDAETGGHLYRVDSEELFWRVVDVAVEGPRVTLAVDRKLLGDPTELAISASAFVEGDEGTAGGDRCPDEGVLTITLPPSA